MKKLFFILFYIPFVMLAHAQQTIVVADTSKVPFKSLLDQLSDQYQVQFYYQNAWLDTLSFSGILENQSLQPTLDFLFSPYGLKYYQLGNKIILTNKQSIIDHPAIMDLATTSVEKSTSNKGLIFEQEYLNSSQQERKTIVIGNRNSQIKTATIAGYLTEKDTNEPIIGALVYVENPIRAATTDASGFYSLQLPTGKHQLLTQFAGMESIQQPIVLFSDGQLDLQLEPDIVTLQEVTIASERDQNVQQVTMGVTKIDVEATKTIPVMLGERDVLKIATTIAGVQTVGEGASGFNVRGGKADQNLVLLNGSAVYNTSHFFGFFSVFNADAIESMELYKGGISATYGGRLSSVFDIQTKSASKTDFNGNGGISPVTSRLSLEIPIKKSQTSLLLSGRSTYSSWILSQVENADFKDQKISFNDLLLHLDHDINEKSNLSVTGYLSNDYFDLFADTLFAYSNFSLANACASVQWQHEFNSDFNSVISAHYSRYGYDITYDESDNNAFTQDFSVEERSIKAVFNQYFQNRHSFAYGADVQLTTINPGSKTPLGSASNINPLYLEEENALTSSVYFTETFTPDEKWTLQVGLRYAIFNALGADSVYQYADDAPKTENSVTETQYYDKGDISQTYHGPEFRFSSKYALNKRSSLKASYNRMRQYIHALSNAASFSPSDTWTISSQHLKPAISDQVSIGYFQNLASAQWEFSLEFYGKKSQNLIDFKTGEAYLLNPTIEQSVLQGDGKAYGTEISIKKSGRLSGWVNYTYARTWIRLDGDDPSEIVNNGNFYPTNYDKPHTVNLVASYQITKRLSVATNSTYNTGRPVTVPIGAFHFRNSETLIYSDRNAYRIPDYFRIDLSISLEGNHKLKKLSHAFWNFSIYNLTGRDNPYSIFFNTNAQGEVEGKKLVVFDKPIPTLTYNFKF